MFIREESLELLPPPEMERRRMFISQKKDWVTFDSEEEDSESSPKQSIISANLRGTNSRELISNLGASGGCGSGEGVLMKQRDNDRLLLELDMRKIFSVEINFSGRTSKKFYGDLTTSKSPGGNAYENLDFKEISMCGFYFGGISSEFSTRLLSCTKAGTFLLRNSSDPKYLFSLSVQTERGPTSVRLVQDVGGKFRLDAADRRLIEMLPGFNSVIDLIQYYVFIERRKNTGRTGGGQVWIDSQTGRTHSVVKLTKPLYKEVPTLKHLCRLKINSQSHPLRPLPSSIVNYIQEYPFLI